MDSAPANLTNGADLTRRISRRLLPFLFLLYVIAYLDRINLGFAALTMNAELGMDAREFGLLTGVFFWAYALFEVPANLGMLRVGASRWMRRLLLAWGCAAALGGLARTPAQLALARFALGAAEAGFFPGVIYYLTLWFKAREQARAVAWFMAAVPVASIIGGPLSGLILQHLHAAGLSGWRWLLILEATPALLCAIVARRLLPAGPAEARFLSPAERTMLCAQLALDRAKREQGIAPSRRRWFQPALLQLLLIHFLFLMGLYAAGFWMPLSIKSVAIGSTPLAIGGWLALPSVATLTTMMLVARSSDRSMERRWHVALPLLASALGLIGLSLAHSLGATVAMWTLVASGIGGYFGPFWARINGLLAGRDAAVGLALVNGIGSLGPILAASLIGQRAMGTHGVTSGLPLIGTCLVAAAVLALIRLPGEARVRSFLPSGVSV